MKKATINIMFICALLIVLAGCGSSKGTAGEEKEAKVLRVATDAAYAPMEYIDKGELTGFDVDFIKAVAKEAGYEVKVENTGWDPLFVEIENKRADLAVSSITIDEKRKQSYDFSHPYFLSTNKILVPKGSPIKSAADLKDKIVAVQAGTTGMAVAEKVLGVNNKNIKKFENNNLAILELTKGGADAVIADVAIVNEYVKNNPKDQLTIIDEESFDKEYYGVMFPKGTKELKEEFNEAINAIFKNGEYAKIYQQWFGEEPDMETLKQQQ
ncbi:MAG: basic amino acid ABC transporter substrate-binding protein [Bacillus sp. (in: firmicutes)]